MPLASAQNGGGTSAIEDHIARDCPVVAAGRSGPDLRLHDGLAHAQGSLLEVDVILQRSRALEVLQKDLNTMDSGL